MKTFDQINLASIVKGELKKLNYKLFIKLLTSTEYEAEII